MGSVYDACEFLDFFIITVAFAEVDLVYELLASAHGAFRGRRARRVRFPGCDSGRGNGRAHSETECSKRLSRAFRQVSESPWIVEPFGTS